MLRVSRMVRVLRRLSELRHIDVIGALGVARVDVVAWDTTRLLRGSLVLEILQSWLVLGGPGGVVV